MSMTSVCVDCVHFVDSVHFIIVCKHAGTSPASEGPRGPHDDHAQELLSLKVIYCTSRADYTANFTYIKDNILQIVEHNTDI